MTYNVQTILAESGKYPDIMNTNFATEIALEINSAGEGWMNEALLRQDWVECVCKLM